MTGKIYLLPAVAFLSALTGAILKINNSTSYGNALLTAGMVIVFIWLITATRKVSVAYLLVKLRWYFLLCAAGVFCMGLFVKMNGYPHPINSFIGAGINTLLFLVSLFVKADKEQPRHKHS